MSDSVFITCVICITLIALSVLDGIKKSKN